MSAVAVSLLAPASDWAETADLDSALVLLADLPREELEGLADAGREVQHCQRVLAKTGDSVVGELMRGTGSFSPWRHYPPGDVYDHEYHAQFYYHAHSDHERVDGEHGHFHTFLRPLGMPSGLRPAPVPDYTPPADPNDGLSHLIGISTDRNGRPFRLFTTNRWVTGETWYAADDVVRMLDCFVIDHARPSWPVNRWLTAVMRLFRPQIIALLHARDQEILRWQESHRDVLVYEDRRLEVPSEMAVAIDTQVTAVSTALRQTRRRMSAVR